MEPKTNDQRRRKITFCRGKILTCESAEGTGISGYGDTILISEHDSRGRAGIIHGGSLA